MAAKAQISRLTLRAAESVGTNCTIQSLEAICRGLGRQSVFLAVPEEQCGAESSVIAVSVKILLGGFESWPLHLMEMVDDFRKSLDPRLILLPPHREVDPRIAALLGSTVLALCQEAGVEPPDWALPTRFLPGPWFVSETDSLKAMAILESPWAFRRNNIYVLENFLKRG
ncbi:MAG: hypothetical protein HYR96_05595 [Deltaproteobacteria bacterium]|nr:hypothetical protein [Deltaproteobacteria bacterium]MBI3295780.1 hypothetical protein [Deltaproteobacteria bacterium]